MKTSFKKIAKDNSDSFKVGMIAAANLANQYNEAFLGPYRLGDCIERQLTPNTKMPRRNKPTNKTFVLARELLLSLKTTDEALVQLARVVSPECWESYEARNGKIDALTAWLCLESLAVAKNVLGAGYRACAPTKPIAACMQKEARKKALASSGVKAKRRAVSTAQRAS